MDWRDCGWPEWRVATIGQRMHSGSFQHDHPRNFVGGQNALHSAAVDCLVQHLSQNICGCGGFTQQGRGFALFTDKAHHSMKISSMKLISCSI